MKEYTVITSVEADTAIQTKSFDTLIEAYEYVNTITSSKNPNEYLKTAFRINSNDNTWRNVTNESIAEWLVYEQYRKIIPLNLSHGHLHLCLEHKEYPKLFDYSGSDDYETYTVCMYISIVYERWYTDGLF